MKRLACPACGKPLLVPNGQAPKSFACPTCKRRLLAVESGLAVAEDANPQQVSPATRPKPSMVPLTAPTKTEPPEPSQPPDLPPTVVVTPPLPPATRELPWWLVPVAVGSSLLVAVAVLAAVLTLSPRLQPDEEAFVPSIVDPLSRYAGGGDKQRAKPRTLERAAVDQPRSPAAVTAGLGQREASAEVSPPAKNQKPAQPGASAAGRDTDDPIQAVLRSVAVIGVEGRSLGSGFVAAPGLLVTNDHVIESTVIRDLRITFPDNDDLAGRSLRAELVHLSVPDDLAFLAIQGDIRPLAIKPEYQHANGQRVVAVGSPGSGGDGPTLENLTTDGRLGPELALDGDGRRWALSMAVNGGNSGGPLVDARTGEVIGVIVAKFTKTEAQSLAIPHAALLRELANATQSSQQARAALLSFHRQRYCLRRMAHILGVTSFAFDRSIAAAVANSGAGVAGMDAAFNECKTSTAKAFAEQFADFSGTVGGEVEELQRDPNCDPRVRRGLKKLVSDIEDQAEEIRRRVPRDEISAFLGRFRASVEGSRALVISLAERLQIDAPEATEVE